MFAWSIGMHCIYPIFLAQNKRKPKYYSRPDFQIHCHITCVFCDLKVQELNDYSIYDLKYTQRNILQFSCDQALEYSDVGVWSHCKKLLIGKLFR